MDRSGADPHAVAYDASQWSPGRRTARRIITVHALLHATFLLELRAPILTLHSHACINPGSANVWHCQLHNTAHRTPNCVALLRFLTTTSPSTPPLIPLPIQTPSCHDYEP